MSRALRNGRVLLLIVRGFIAAWCGWLNSVAECGDPESHRRREPKSWAQWGQDRFLLEHVFPVGYEGVFVELGSASDVGRISGRASPGEVLVMVLVALVVAFFLIDSVVALLLLSLLPRKTPPGPPKPRPEPHQDTLPVTSLCWKPIGAFDGITHSNTFLLEQHLAHPEGDRGMEFRMEKKQPPAPRPLPPRRPWDKHLA